MNGPTIAAFCTRHSAVDATRHAAASFALSLKTRYNRQDENAVQEGACIHGEPAA